MQEQSNNNKINDGIKKFQEEKRKETKELIENAITTLNDIGKKVTVAKLVELTGLHRTTFYKEDIRPLWDEKYKTRKVEVSKIKDSKELEKLLEEIIKEKERIHKKYLKSLEKKEELEEKNKNIQIKLDEEKKKNEILRGQILKLQSENSILRNS